MAGFKRNPVYVLDFEAYPELKGLEVRVKATTMQEQLEIAALMDGINVNSPQEMMITINAALETLAENIISWNLLDDDDQPRPATLATLLSLDAEFQRALIAGWTQTLSGVSDDLGKGSSSGASFPEGSLPMETLSAPLLS
jgi:hypothetical protein